MLMQVHIGLLFFSNKSDIVYLDSFGVEYIFEEIKEFVEKFPDRPSPSASQNKNIIASIFRVQANDSVMCGYFCIGFIEFLLAGKKLTDYTNLFSSYELQVQVLL